MKGTNRPGERKTSGVARHLATGRIVLVLVALMSVMLLSPACSNEAASSGNSTSIELADALASGKPTLAGFVGKVCACKNITPTLEELAAEYDGKCNILILEKDDNNELFSQYSIFLVPTQVYFDSTGAEVERVIGASTKDEMVERLAGMGV